MSLYWKYLPTIKYVLKPAYSILPYDYPFLCICAIVPNQAFESSLPCFIRLELGRQSGWRCSGSCQISQKIIPRCILLPVLMAGLPRALKSPLKFCSEATRCHHFLNISTSQLMQRYKSQVSRPTTISTRLLTNTQPPSFKSDNNRLHGYTVKL